MQLKVQWNCLNLRLFSATLLISDVDQKSFANDEEKTGGLTSLYWWDDRSVLSCQRWHHVGNDMWSLAKRPALRVSNINQQHNVEAYWDCIATHGFSIQQTASQAVAGSAGIHSGVTVIHHRIPMLRWRRLLLLLLLLLLLVAVVMQRLSDHPWTMASPYQSLTGFQQWR
jgi:hypothetical protein